MPETSPETSVVEHEIAIAAAPETVFAYFTDPARMVRWMGAEATLDPRPGGICRIAFGTSAPVVAELTAPFVAEEDRRLQLRDGGVMTGRFVEVDPYRRIVLTWGWEQEALAVPQSTEVEITFTPDGDGTVLRLTHRRLPAQTAAFHRAGWDHFLARLAVAAGGGDPGRDPWQATPR
jgi:uncharacterized protein YndB with AHSA1/START domain